MGILDCRSNLEVDGEVRACETGSNWSDKSPSTAVIEAVANFEDTDPIDLAAGEGIVLHDYIDPDALDELVMNNHENDIAVTFSIDDYTVWINGDELVVALTETDSLPFEHKTDVMGP